MTKSTFKSLYVVLALFACSHFVSSCAAPTEETIVGEKQPVELTLSTDELTFDLSGKPSDEFDGKIQITTNSEEWSIVVPSNAKWLNATPKSGSGDQEVRISMAKYDESRDIFLSLQYADENGEMQEKKIHIIQGYIDDGEQGSGGEAGDLIFSEIIGSENVDDNYPVYDYTGWSATGSGAIAVKYSGQNATVRYNSHGSVGYEGASNGNNVFLGSLPANFIIEDIAMVDDQTNLRLTFGVNRYVYGGGESGFDPSKMTVSVGADGEGWAAIPVDNFVAAEGGSWSFITSDFTLAKSVPILKLKFEVSEASTMRVDDITLTVGEGGDKISFGGVVEDSSDEPYNKAGEPRWAELPARVENEDYLYVTHTAELDGVEVRNYSMCFDIENRAAAWVAFPYHSVYDGNVGRTDEWGYDPKIPQQYQPNLSKSYDGDYDRGHQISSQDRQANDELNAQTFYYSNMSPQLGSLNGGKWASLEEEVRKQNCSDTLYVVTGADFKTSIGVTYDVSDKACTLPGAYYKILLRTKSGKSGKAVSECSADELIAIGFWYEHKYYKTYPEPVSVSEIEKRTGFDFFPLVPDSVKESFDSSDWNFNF